MCSSDLVTERNMVEERRKVKGSQGERNRSLGKSLVFESVRRGKKTTEGILGRGKVRRRSNEREIEE